MNFQVWWTFIYMRAAIDLIAYISFIKKGEIILTNHFDVVYLLYKVMNHEKLDLYVVYFIRALNGIEYYDG